MQHPTRVQNPLNEASHMVETVTPYLKSRRQGNNEDIDMEGAANVGFHQTPQRQHVQRQSNSTSTIYANSTIANPNVSEVMMSVASVLHCIMLQNAIPMGGMAPDIQATTAMFDERSYTKKETRKRLRWGFNRTNADDERDSSKRAFPDEGVPPVTEIYYFMMACSQRASFSIECSIIALVLLNRLLTTPHDFVISLHAFNWRLFFLTALMIAQKIWEDIALANIDFPIIWRHAMKVDDDRLDVRAFNLMEARFLELLSFNVYVSGSLYGQFCFELRTIHSANSNSAFPVEPLTPEQAARLEASTAVNPEVLRKHVKGMSKSATADMRGKHGQFVLS